MPPRSLLGSQEPTHKLTPPSVFSRGDEAIELAEIAGLTCDRYQRHFLRDSLGVGADGKWTSFEAFIELARQNGKSVIFEVRCLAGLFLFRERLITYSAHKGETALEAFRRIDDMISDVPELKAEVRRVSRTNGKEAIELVTGQRIKFRTRTAGGGRGLTGDTVIVDEAQDADEFEVAALLPLVLARPNPQVMYGGSAGGPNSVVLGRLIRRLDRGDPRLTGYRFAASEDDDPAAPKTWARTNPALGRRIMLETIANLQRSLPPERFAQEILTIGDYPREEGEEWVIPRSAWERCQDPKSVPVGKVVFALEVKWGRDAASIAIAGRRADGEVHGEVTRRDVGTAWVPKELARQMADNPNLGVVLDPSSPAGALLGPLADEGITPTLLKLSDITQAFGSLYDMATAPNPAFHHRGAAILTMALAAASTRKVGDSTTWRRQGTVDVAPLLAVNWAVHALTMLAPGPAPKAQSPRSATVDRPARRRPRGDTADLATASF